MHSIFKIGISRNMKCAYMVSFLKYSHKYVNVMIMRCLWAVLIFTTNLKLILRHNDNLCLHCMYSFVIRMHLDRKLYISF